MATFQSLTRSLLIGFAMPGQSGFLATLALAAAFAAVAPMAFAQTPPPAAPAPKPTNEAGSLPHSAAELSDAAGNVIGLVRIADTPSGELHVIADLKGLPPGGTQAIHIHKFGKCEPPKFESAGDHLAVGKQHGALHPGGQHQGDMPNLTVAADGTAKVEYFSSGVKVADVTDADGGAVVVYAKSDDYKSQPAGAAGDRVACGVFSAAKSRRGAPQIRDAPCIPAPNGQISPEQRGYSWPTTTPTHRQPASCLPAKSWREGGVL